MAAKSRMLKVSAVQHLSPHIKRVTLTGDELSDFPVNKESAHVKVIFPQPGAKDNKPKLGMYFGFKKWRRSYTVSQFDQQKLALSIDFCINDHQGLGANWAQQAKPGDYLGISGPSGLKHTDFMAKQHVFFGDMTALSAIAATLAKLPEQAKGYAWIQVASEQDIRTLSAPCGIQVNWFVTEHKQTPQFLTAVQSLPADLRDTAIFIAAETSIVKQLKKYLSQHCQYDKKKLYASAYWNAKK